MAFNMGNPFNFQTVDDNHVDETLQNFLDGFMVPLSDEETLDDVLSTINMDDLINTANIVASSTTSNANINKMRKELEVDQEQKIHISSGNDGRFKKLNADELKAIESKRQAASTKKNTKWGTKLFQDWCLQRGFTVDLATISATELNEKLRIFYAEAQPKDVQKRAQTKSLTPGQASEYHKNSMKSIRSAINRYFKDIKRDIDIVRDKEFRSANQMLDGKLKDNVRKGLSVSTKHKSIVKPGDLMKIATYLHAEPANPINLRFRVWYDIAIHFVTRGLEIHQQLTLTSFKFSKDENNDVYVTLNHETKQKTKQGGLISDEDNADKRMYSTGTAQCPVKSLRMFLKKTDPSAKSLFNHCNKDALNDQSKQFWYTTTPVKHYQFSRFMAEISKKAGCSEMYTAHCLRATSIHYLSLQDVELRHIMYYSSHKNESSVRSYTRECSTKQKKNISATLSTLSSLETVPEPQINLSVATPCCTPNAMPYMTRVVDVSSRSAPHTVTSNMLSSGFISNSNFTNCVFQFGQQQ